MQKEYTGSCTVFESDGMVRNAGWAKKPVFMYDPSSRHSQRDTYFISNNECAMYLGVRRSEIKEKETERRGMCTKRLCFV